MTGIPCNELATCSSAITLKVPLSLNIRSSSNYILASCKLLSRRLPSSSRRIVLSQGCLLLLPRPTLRALYISTISFRRGQVCDYLQATHCFSFYLISALQGTAESSSARDYAKRKEQLDLKEKELNAREAELKRQQDELIASGAIKPKKNWPICYPIVHHDIKGEVTTSLPNHFQTLTNDGCYSVEIRSFHICLPFDINNNSYIAEQHRN